MTVCLPDLIDLPDSGINWVRGFFSLSNFRSISNFAFISCRACSEMYTASFKFLFCSTTSMKILRKSRIFSSLFSFCCFSDDMEEKWISIFSILWNVSWGSMIGSPQRVCDFLSRAYNFRLLRGRIFSHLLSELDSLVPSIKRGYIFLWRHCNLH